MSTRTKFVFLLHPEEFKRAKAATGRLTHLCLADSELYSGTAFDDHSAVQALINDPANFPVLLYPTRDARDLSKGEFTPADTGGRRLVVFLLDATWHLVRHIWRDSPSLRRLPRIMFSAAAPSRYVIKHQPEAACLSTLEATHELLLALDRSGLDQYAMPDQLLGLFQRMQDVQLAFAAESARLGRQRHAPRNPPPAAPRRPPNPAPNAAASSPPPRRLRPPRCPGLPIRDPALRSCRRRVRSTPVYPKKQVTGAPIPGDEPAARQPDQRAQDLARDGLSGP